MAVIKVQPEDFVVREKIRPLPEGSEYGLYVLRKKGRTTFDVVREVSYSLGVKLSAVSFGGLKDKWAVTYQYITVKGVIGRKAGGTGWKLSPAEPVSVARAITKDDVLGNDFEIVVRDLSPSDVDAALERLPLTSSQGFVNYFGPQRFGSFYKGDWAAKAMIQRRLKDALLLMLTPKTRARCAPHFLGDNFDPSVCVRLAKTRWEKEVFKYLTRHPDAYRSALRIVPSDQKAMAALAYQSFVWNMAVSTMVLEEAEEVFSIDMLGVPLNFPEEEFKPSVDPFPYPSPYLKPDEMPDYLKRVLIREGIPPDKFKTRVWGVTFPLRYRSVMVKPSMHRVGHSADEWSGRMKMQLSFFLPKGSYATVLLADLLGEFPKQGARRKS